MPENAYGTNLGNLRHSWQSTAALKTSLRTARFTVVGDPTQLGRHVLTQLLSFVLHARIEDVEDEVFLLHGIEFKNVLEMRIEKRVMCMDKIPDVPGACVATCCKACIEKNGGVSDQRSYGMSAEALCKIGRCGHVQCVAASGSFK